MKNPIRSLIQAYRETELAFTQKNYKEVIRRARSVLENQELAAEQADPFLYYLAIALQIDGQCLTALPIIMDLQERNPSHLNYASGTRIVIQSIKARASALADKDPYSPALRRYAAILEDLDFCPYRVVKAVALQEVRAGQPDRAKARMQALVELSPNDTAFLEAALEVCEASGAQEWRRNLIARVEAIVRARPYLLEHQGLLDRFRLSDAA